MIYTRETIHGIVERQKEFFRTDETLNVNFRIKQLKKLKKAITDNEEMLLTALNKDLGRSRTEGYLCDIGMTIMEINETISGLRKWAKPETHSSGLLAFPSSRTKVYKMPYGTVVIFSPFNFPVLLSLGVLAAAISGGNTAVLKVSSKSKSCSAAIEKIIAENFTPEYITVINGGHDAADLCLEERFDKIFYTGSPKVAGHIMEEAAKNLTPVALELGGENGNWCIVRKDADLKNAVRKIVFFKLLNCGQICININQVAVAEEIADKFVKMLADEFRHQITDNAVNNNEYPKLIDQKAYDKCENEAAEYKDRIIYGGTGNREVLKFSPTVIYPVDIDEKIVNHELFCPLLPVVKFKDCEVEKLLEKISMREKPLAFYVFTSNIGWAEKTMRRMQYGGGCVNEVCYHMIVKGVPFNGVGHSGMGAYHGEWGFREFTHPQTVLFGRQLLDLPLRYHPYEGKKKMKMIKFFQK